MQTEFTTPFEETSPQELNKRLQKFYLSLRKSDDRGWSVIARQKSVSVARSDIYLAASRSR